MKILLVLLVFLNPDSKSCPPEKVVDEFYKWYVDGGYKQMKPSFVENENGMTTLDFKGYDELHRRFGFSELLIENSKSIYQECQTNLSTLLFDKFNQFEDLDQFEQINCSFQFWIWFGSGMEPFGYHQIIRTKKLNGDKYEVTVGLAWNEGKEFDKLIPVIVEHINSEWKIVDIIVKVQ